MTTYRYMIYFASSGDFVCTVVSYEEAIRRYGSWKYRIVKKAVPI